MNKYYIVIDNESEGPFTIDKLKEKKINEETLVWWEGEDDWREAQNVTALEGIFKAEIPPLPDQKNEYQKGRKSNLNKKTFANELKVYGKVLGVALAISLVISLVYYSVELNQVQNPDAALDKYDRGYFPNAETRIENRRNNFDRYIGGDVAGIIFLGAMVGTGGYIVFRGIQWVNKNSD